MVIPTHEQGIRDISVLIPSSHNSRTHSDEQIKQICDSMQRFGFTAPVIIDEENNIIAGHCRVLAADSVGIKDIPVVVLQGLTDVEKEAYLIADNKLSLNAGWDFNVLQDRFKYLLDNQFDLALTGFNEDEIASLMPPDDVVGLCDEDEAPCENVETRCAPGDLWLLGDHRLLCGDSTVSTDVERLMGGELADLLITDPPYNVEYTGKTKDSLKIENDSMSDEDFRTFLRDAFVSADMFMKPGACFYIWHADSEGYNFRGACMDAGWTVRQCLIWNKNTIVMGRQDYHWKHEPCLYGWKEGKGHHWASDRKQSTVLEFNKPMRNDVHPTMKPVELIEYQLMNNTKLNWNVLDLFAGSGTTLIACEKNRRKSYNMELDPKYCDVILARWEKFTGKKAVRDGE